MCIRDRYPTYSSAGAGVSGDGISYGIFAWPTSGIITSQFAPRWGSFHGALDIANSEGTPISAADGGVVTVSEWHYSYGYYIMIDHGNGYETLYGHNSVLIANVGDRVSRGQTIALMGSTGNSTGPHCHFEVRINGTRVDPELYHGIISKRYVKIAITKNITNQSGKSDIRLTKTET